MESEKNETLKFKLKSTLTLTGLKHGKWFFLWNEISITQNKTWINIYDDYD